jgi:RNA polymerase sigma-70 factor (ECF subfamily)
MNPSDRVWRERGLRDAVLAGDERAWQAWYDESFAGLAAYVAWRCAGLADMGDEIIQETWLTAVRRVRAFDPEQGSFAGWLRGIAAHLLRNHFRRQARRARLDQSLNGRLPAMPPAERVLEEREQAQRIARALTSLPEHYEAVLRAKYLDEESVVQIAESRNETPKTVESLLTRARQAFREAYRRLENIA